MFGATNPFGQSPMNPFGSQSPFGQTSNAAASSPLAPKPFGSTTPFGLQSGSTIFGSNSTGVFGAAQTSSPLSSTTAFSASSSPAFGSSMPAFGSSSSSFGGSSLFGQKPAFGSFVSTNQTSPFGSSTQQSQPAFGSNLFGSTAPFGASSQPVFGASTPGFGSTTTMTFGSSSTHAFGSCSTPAIGSSSTPAFGASSTPAFGATSTPAFGASASPFGVTSTPAFDSGASPAFAGTSATGFGSSAAFGASSASLFGSSSTPAFGASSSPVFGSSSTPSFGASSTPAFGASNTSAFGASTTPFGFASGAAFGQSTSALANSSFGTSTSPFSGQSSPFGSTAGSIGLGQSTFGAQCGGSRIAPYIATTEAESSGGQPGKLESVAAMPIYKDKSHEELRWEDYKLGDKGGPTPPGQAPTSIGVGKSTVSSNPSASSPLFGQSSASQFSTISTNANPFASKPPSFGVSTTSAFSTSPFGSSSHSFPSVSFPSTSTAFAGTTSASIFGASGTSAFGSTPTLFNSSAAQGTASPFPNMCSNTQPSLSFASSAPSLGQTGSTFGQNTTPSFNASNLFNSPSTGFGGLYSSTPSLVPSSNPVVFGQTTSSSFQLAQPSQSTGAFGFNNIGQTLSASTSGFVDVSRTFGQSNFGQLSSTQNSVSSQSMPVSNPFGTLPVMPQVSIGRPGTTPSVQYGISSLPVVDKPATIRISSLLTSWHLSQRRFRLLARKYNPSHDSPKVPFFSDEEETLSTPKADALFIPRENPRALVIHPVDQLPLKAKAEKTSSQKDASSPLQQNGKAIAAVDASPVNGPSAGGKENLVEDGIIMERRHQLKFNQKLNGVQEDNHIQKEVSYVTFSGHRAGEAAIVYEHGADIEALMPKLRHLDYYTEPRIQELAAKERARPGYCRHVKDFVVGRDGFGNIKFLGETDVQRLDLESLVQFNNREVIVYMDDSKKPPVGQGLNKPAEVTLLNIKCFDKKTGRQYTEGPKIEKYKEMLKRKAEDQGAEFVLYDPIKGEWKFKVNHFSKYKLEENAEAAE